MKRLLVLIIFAFALSCNNKSESTSSSAADSLVLANTAKDSILAGNKATALAFQEALGKGQLNDVVKNLAADAIDYGNGSRAPIKGLDSIKANIKTFLDAFPDTKGENFAVIAEGNQVAVFGDWSGTFKNAMMGMKPTGKSFKIKDVDIFKFNDAGKITEHRSIQSDLAIMSQIRAK